MKTLEEAQAEGLAPWDTLVDEELNVKIYLDKYPVTPGHMLFVPTDDTALRVCDALASAIIRGEQAVAAGVCDGYNVGFNRGPAAGQTVMYPHVHLIPRKQGDTPDPTGGVRNVIPGKGKYEQDGNI